MAIDSLHSQCTNKLNQHWLKVERNEILFNPKSERDSLTVWQSVQRYFGVGPYGYKTIFSQVRSLADREFSDLVKNSPNIVEALKRVQKGENVSESEQVVAILEQGLNIKNKEREILSKLNAKFFPSPFYLSLKKCIHLATHFFMAFLITLKEMFITTESDMIRSLCERTSLQTAFTKRLCKKKICVVKLKPNDGPNDTFILNLKFHEFVQEMTLESEFYGERRGRLVFYASKNKLSISSYQASNPKVESIFARFLTSLLQQTNLSMESDSDKSKYENRSESTYRPSQLRSDGNTITNLDNILKHAQRLNLMDQFVSPLAIYNAARVFG